ncbi:18565_t:CDS:2 [Gigaspora margarita]|uniref:18565_t:CDS:1 n=1 Tax=Gigaspora margarita TaxID=4874 RepID=A0ABN7UMC3_GIGMA|nr:18565_t:CDS:2 [Gigaspora margarita]
MSNWPLTNECATKMACIRWHIGQEKNLSNFDDMDNSDNKSEPFEEENIMQTIANIDNFNTNDQITYNKQ